MTQPETVETFLELFKEGDVAAAALLQQEPALARHDGYKAHPLLHEFVYSLQLVTAEYSGWLLRALGQSAFIAGDQIIRPDQHFAGVEGEGLAEGIPVVIRGNERIFPGSPVRVAGEEGTGAPAAGEGESQGEASEGQS